MTEDDEGGYRVTREAIEDGGVGLVQEASPFGVVLNEAEDDVLFLVAGDFVDEG